MGGFGPTLLMTQMFPMKSFACCFVPRSTPSSPLFISTLGQSSEMTGRPSSPEFQDRESQLQSSLSWKLGSGTSPTSVSRSRQTGMLWLAFPSPRQGPGPARMTDVRSVIIDGRAVLYTPEPYRLIELDETQTLWWLLFDGTPLDDTVNEVVRETGSPSAAVIAAGRACIEGFESLGLLQSP
jgi:hypothetical protein